MILIWMVKLIKLRLHNHFYLVILLAFNSTFCLSGEGLYNQLVAGKFTKNSESFIQEIHDNDSKRLWDNDSARIEYLYTLLDSSFLIPNKKGYMLASDLLFDYQSNATDPYLNYQIQYFITLHSLSLMDTSEKSTELINDISNILPHEIFVGDRVIWAYNQLIDNFLEVQEYSQAFRYSMLGLAQLVKQPNTSAYQVFSFLVRLAQTQAEMGKTNHFKHTFNLVAHIYDNYNNSVLPNAPFTIDNTARIASASTDAADTGPAHFVYEKISDQRKAGIEIPPRTMRSISDTFAYTLASSGADVDYRAIFSPLKESGHSDKSIDTSIYRHELLSKISRGEEIKSYSDAHFYTEAFKEETFLTVDLYKNSQTISESQFIEKLNEIREVALDQLKDHATIYDFDFNNTYYVDNTIKTLLLSVHSRYKGAIPEAAAALIIPLIETNRSELDLITKAKNIKHTYSESKSSEVKLLLNVNKDLEYLTSQYLSQVEENLKKSSEKFIEDIAEYRSRGNTLVAAIKKIDYYSEHNDPLVINDVLYPSSIDLSEIKKSLDDSHLFYYKVMDNIMFSCLISNKKINCITKLIDSNGAYTKEELFNAISIKNKAKKINTNKILNYFYNYVFGGHDYSLVKKIHLYPQEKDATIPFATFQDNDGVFLAEKFELSLLPSLILRLESTSKPNFTGEYFGIANPSYGAVRSAIEDNTNMFNIRSASISDELSSLTQLPDTEMEVISASASMGPDKKKLLLREDATEYKLRTSGFENYRMLHFATHGIVTGEFNGLRLPSLALSLESTSSTSSTDGLLNSNEISNLEINSDIAILSACQTLSDYGAGETGFSGLVSAFMASGVDSVLATMWKIESSSAAIIAANFVQNSSSSNDYSNALHKTYKKYIHSQKYSSPFYWAPFVLVEQLKTEVQSKTNGNHSKIIVENSQKVIDMTTPSIGKDETWSVLFEDRGDGVFKNFLFDFTNKEKNPVSTFNTTILSIEKDRIIFMGRTILNKSTNIEIYSLDKSTKKIQREQALENSKGFLAQKAANTKDEYAFYLTNNKLGQEKKSIISIYNADYSLKRSIDVTKIEKDHSRRLVLDVMDNEFVFVVNHSNGYTEPKGNLHKGYISCELYDNQISNIYFIDEQVGLYIPDNFKNKKIYADGFVVVGETNYAIWRDYCNQETVFTPLDSPSHKQIRLPNLSTGIFSGMFHGKRYIAGDFRTKSSFLVDYYKEGGDSKFSFSNVVADNLILGDEKVTFSIMIEDEDFNWRTVYSSPKDILNTSLMVNVDHQVFKRMYIDKYTSIHEEEIEIR